MNFVGFFKTLLFQPPTANLPTEIDHNSVIKSKEEVAADIVEGRITTADAVKTYGFTRSTLKYAVQKFRSHMTIDANVDVLDCDANDSDSEAPLYETSDLERLSMSEKVDTVLNLIQNDDLTIIKACNAVGITRNAYRWEMKLRQRVADGEERQQKGGRKRCLAEVNISQLQEEAHQRDLHKNSFTNASLRERIDELRGDEAIASGGNAASVKPISTRTLQRVAGVVAPKIVDAPQIQNSRRLEALKDTYSPVTHVATVHKLLDVSAENPNGTMKPCYMYNMDAVQQNLMCKTTMKTMDDQRSNAEKHS